MKKLALAAAFGLSAASSLLPLSAQAQSQRPIIVTDPDAVVLGHTLTEWTALWLRWAFATPAPTPPSTANAFNDPTGTYAQAYNPGPIFLVTGIGAATTRTLTVAQGTPILFPIASLEDTEGPNGISPPLISPSIPSSIYPIPPGTYAGEVRKVLNDSGFRDIVLKVDGKVVNNLQESIITDFSAGVVAQGSEGQVFFTGPPGLPVGTELFPSGTEGYWVIIEGLGVGVHTIYAQATTIAPYFGCPQGCKSSRTDTIKVVAH
jgi:hypothetical protein